MSKLSRIGYSLCDVDIVPSPITNFEHRKEANIFTEICGRESYPIFIAPMEAVTNETNYIKWIDNKLTPVVPRNVMERLSFEERLNIAEETFVSISLDEAVEFSEYEDSGFEKKYICIDLANGHMKKLLDVCTRLKDIYGERLEIMTGNIANPKAYSHFCEACIDWVRINIGTGNRCQTSDFLGVHYPSATLLDEMVEERDKYLKYEKDCNCHYTKIIYDGGINGYADINKALAMGADAVMIGKLFAECEEACGEVLYCKNENEFINGNGYYQYELNNMFLEDIKKLTPYRMYSGMSHKSMQKMIGGDGRKESEGFCKPVEVKYPVSVLLKKVASHLRSAMSYTNSFTLDQFKNSEIIIHGGSGYKMHQTI